MPRLAYRGIIKENKYHKRKWYFGSLDEVDNLEGKEVIVHDTLKKDTSKYGYSANGEVTSSAFMIDKDDVEILEVIGVVSDDTTEIIKN